MSTVNDLMTYLNEKLGLGLPVLPLGRFTRALTNLWNAVVKNWTPGTTPPATVEIDLPEPVNMPIAGGTIQITKASIEITQQSGDSNGGN